MSILTEAEQNYSSNVYKQWHRDEAWKVAEKKRKRQLAINHKLQVKINEEKEEVIAAQGLGGINPLSFTAKKVR